MRVWKLSSLIIVFIWLFGCGDQTLPQPPAIYSVGIDETKIDRIAFDFHLQFFDDDLQPVELTADEVAFFLARKARLRQEALSYAEHYKDYYDGQGDYSRNGAYPKHDEISMGAPPMEPLPEPIPYTDRCRSAGVSTPPAFAAAPWEELGSLEGEQIFSDPRFSPLYIWRFVPKDPLEGVCAATVRYMPGKAQNPKDKAENVQVVGVICEGKMTGNACFWASEDDPFGKEIENFSLNGDTIPTFVPFTGDDGTKGTKPLKCTFCHLGENAFIVHPGTVLGPKVFADEKERAATIGVTSKPDKRYTPVSIRNLDNTNFGDRWGNPLAELPDPDNLPPAKNQDDCNSCHSFAVANNIWCEDVLQKTLGKTMPPPLDGETSAERLPEFEQSLRLLRAECAEVGYLLKF